MINTDIGIKPMHYTHDVWPPSRTLDQYNTRMPRQGLPTDDLTSSRIDPVRDLIKVIIIKKPDYVL